METTDVTLPDDRASAVDALADRFWEAILELNPTTATVYGDERYADRLEDPSPAGRAKGRKLMEETKAAAEALPVDDLSVEERITRDMLIVIADQAIEEDDQGTHRLRVVDQISGPQTLLPQVCQFQPADTPERLEKFIARLEAYRDYMAANADILREGLDTGLTAPRIVADRTVAQLERLLAIPLAEAIVPALAKVTNDAARERVRKVTEQVIYPADQAFLDVLRGDYLKATREEPGLWSATNGESLYRTQIRSWTTLELDPSTVHQIGLDELALIDEGRRAIASAAGAASPQEYRQRLLDDPANTPSTKDELLDRAREDIDRAMAVAPRFFGRLPKSGLEVMAVEEFKEKDAPFAYYFPPAPDGSRPGIYYACPATTSRSPSSRRTPTCRRSGGWGHGSSVARTSKAGACTARSWPTRWASSATMASGSGCSTPSPGERLAWSSTPGSMRSAGPASSRSTSCSRPACRRPTRRSRPIATSSGPARR